MLSARLLAVRYVLSTLFGSEEGGMSKTAIWSATCLLFVFSHSSALADDLSNVPTISSAEPQYRLGSEDVVDVFVWKEPDLSRTVIIRPDGKISLPLANEIEANGKTVSELQEEITARLKKYLSQPVVNVMVKQINSMKISVLGEVRKPDVYHIKSSTSILDAIAMAGGFTDLAKPEKVVIIRGSGVGLRRIRINIKQLVSSGDSTPFYLQPKDTVYVE